MKLGINDHKKYLQKWRKSRGKTPLEWIGEDVYDNRPKWLDDSYQNLRLKMRCNDVLVAIDAVKRGGLGVARLPCFVGDNDPDMQALPSSQKLPEVPLWILKHPDLCHVERVSVFSDFLTIVFDDSM